MKGLILIVAAALTQSIYAQPEPHTGRAEVWEVTGKATASTQGGSAQPLKAGSEITEGAVVRTDARCAVDLRFGRIGAVLRITENTVVSMDRLRITERSNESFCEIELRLSRGTVLGQVRNLPRSCRFELKLPDGIARVQSGQFRANSQGYLVTLQGSIAFAHVPLSRQPVLHTLTAPPPVYFSPVEGVKRAPTELVREVREQLTARLGRR